MWSAVPALRALRTIMARFGFWGWGKGGGRRRLQRSAMGHRELTFGDGARAGLSLQNALGVRGEGTMALQTHHGVEHTPGYTTCG